MIDKIEQIIRDFLAEKEISVPFVVEYSDSPQKGHITTNVALIASKMLGEKPFNLANLVAKRITDSGLSEIDRIEVAGPGFINIFLARSYLTQVIKNIIQNPESFGKSAPKTHEEKNSKNDSTDKTNQTIKTILYEYTDPNPFKEFHIGHLMSNTVGEAMSRIATTQGYEVKRAIYQGDVGSHIAKTIWGLMNTPKKDEETDIQYMGRAYAYGSEQYEQNPDTQVVVKQINTEIYSKNNEEILKLYNWGRKISLEYFESLYKIFGTKFDYYFFESEMAERAVAIAKECVDKGIFELSDGAVVYRGERHGLHTRVFINSQGIPTYEAKELVLDLVDKPTKVGADLNVVITANEQNDYFKVVLEVMKEIDPVNGAKILHFGHGMMRLTTGKISSRKGGVPTAEDFIGSTADAVLEVIKDRDFTDDEKKEISSKLALGAIKYTILRQSVGSDIIFDPKTALSFLGDSGPYLMYAYVRALSVLEKAAGLGLTPKVVLPPDVISEPELLLISMPHVFSRAHYTNSPNLIVTFATKLAGAFNLFYANTKIIDTEDPGTAYRLAITKASAEALKRVFETLAIPIVTKM